MALLQKMTCNLWHPMGLRHPVQYKIWYIHNMVHITSKQYMIQCNTMQYTSAIKNTVRFSNSATYFKTGHENMKYNIQYTLTWHATYNTPQSRQCNTVRFSDSTIYFETGHENMKYKLRYTSTWHTTYNTLQSLQCNAMQHTSAIIQYSTLQQ